MNLYQFGILHTTKGGLKEILDFLGDMIRPPPPLSTYSRWARIIWLHTLKKDLPFAFLKLTRPSKI